MRTHYKNKDLLKNQAFSSEEIKNSKKKNKDFSNIRFLSELPFFPKKHKKLTNTELSKEFPFPPKRKKRPTRLTKHQILSNILPFYDSVGISRREHALKYYAETYNVEIIDRIILADSLFLAKSSIINLFKDILRGFKYNLEIKGTLERWNNANNRFDIETIYIKTNAITVINQVVI